MNDDRTPKQIDSSNESSKPLRWPLLMKIPGMPEEQILKRVQVNGKEYQLLDLLGAACSSNEKAAAVAVHIAADLTDLNRSELQAAVSALWHATRHSNTFATTAFAAVRKIISAHEHRLETTHLVLQMWKQAARSDAEKTFEQELVDVALAALMRAQSTPVSNRHTFLETRYVAIRALEIPVLRSSGLAVLKKLLQDRSSTLRLDRKDLASNLLGILKVVAEPAETVRELKRIASVVLATGIAPPEDAATNQFSEGDRRPLVFVTSQQAEIRKQYGLATGLETRKALTVRGRDMSIDEYATCVRFGAITQPSLPSNQSFFTRAEWNTAYRIIALGSRDPSIPALEIAALLLLLATRIKVEDPSDPRESKSRPDVLASEERERAARDSQAVAEREKISFDTVTARAAELSQTLLSGEFRSWKFTTMLQALEPSSPTLAEESKAETVRVVNVLLTNDSTAAVTRMSPAEMNALRVAQDLSLEEFKTVTARIRSRAVSCEWARGAILDLVRAPHHPSVTAQVRTAVLGGLVNDARKIGRLTRELEKEVFAVSAEIPALPFVSGADADDAQEETKLAS